MSVSNQFPGKVNSYFDVAGTSSHNLTALVYIPELRASQVVLVVKNLTANAGRRKRCKFDPWVGKIP